MGVRELEELDVFRDIEAWADAIWHAVRPTDIFVQQTLGKQLVNAADSVVANMVEGDGRGTPRDRLRFFEIARGSLKEARLWLTRAGRRRVIDETLAKELSEKATRFLKALNAIISYRRQAAGLVSEESEEYRIMDTVTDDSG